MADSTVTVKFVPEIDEEALLNAVVKILSGVAVVKPGETLVLRVQDWPFQAVDDYQRHFDRLAAEDGLPFRVLVVSGDELAVAAEPSRLDLGPPPTPEQVAGIKRRIEEDLKDLVRRRPSTSAARPV